MNILVGITLCAIAGHCLALVLYIYCYKLRTQLEISNECVRLLMQLVNQAVENAKDVEARLEEVNTRLMIDIVPKSKTLN
jgi:hypothetical protein